MCVVGGRNHARAEEYAQVWFPTVFDRRCEGERLAGTGVQLDAGRILHAVRIQNVISGRAGVAVVAVCGVERQHPPPRQAVLPGRVEKEGASGLGLPSEACFSAVDTDTFYVHVVEKPCDTLKRMRRMRPFGSQKYV